MKYFRFIRPEVHCLGGLGLFLSVIAYAFPVLANPNSASWKAFFVLLYPGIITNYLMQGTRLPWIVDACISTLVNVGAYALLGLVVGAALRRARWKYGLVGAVIGVAAALLNPLVQSSSFYPLQWVMMVFLVPVYAMFVPILYIEYFMLLPRGYEVALIVAINGVGNFLLASLLGYIVTRIRNRKKSR